MEWGKAKQFVIVLLLLLNVVLAGLNYQQNRESVMTAAQERAVFEVLSRHGITMYTDLPKDSVPMPRLRGEIPSYSKETMERLFFNGQKTSVVKKGDATVYRKDARSLSLEGSLGNWENTEIPMGKEGLSRADAIETAELFLTGTEHFFGSYGEAMAVEQEEGFQVFFYGTYKRETVFSNMVSVFVTQGGIRSITFQYCPIAGYSGEKKDICYADEALLTFMREWRKEGKPNEATIYRMELGYDLRESSTVADAASVELEPFYRIYLMEEDEPYLINAYTCQRKQ